MKLKDLDDQTALILANALYFKGIWEVPFVDEMTKDDKFYLLNGEEVEVPFMCERIGTHLYGSFDGFKVLKLPYKNKQDQRQFYMYFYLPDERDGLTNLLHQLNPNSEFLKHQLMLKKERISNLRIPKFKFPYDFNVSKVIRSLGLTQPSIVLHLLMVMKLLDPQQLLGTKHILRLTKWEQKQPLSPIVVFLVVLNFDNHRRP
ncbi:serpin-ZX-like [Castanea sativa]|uniref:serpin-ZX-like n=1 Tax=Castanea sativa TaxID=21020 RepID=UPI003F64FC78